MRTLSEQEERIYSQSNRGLALRVKIADSGGTLQDIEDTAGGPWLLGAEWGEDVDSPGQTATIDLRTTNDLNQLSPLAVEARQAGVIALYRAVTIEVAILPFGATPSVWVEVFRGKIDSISWPGGVMQLSCRDQIAQLQDRLIEVPAVFSTTFGTALETVLQDILDDTLGIDAPTLYTPTSPGWNITQFTTTQQSVIEQLTLLTDQIGWNLRYRWDSGTSAFRLTLYEPDRSSTTSLYTFGPDRVLSWGSLDLSLENIRNVCVVTYGDAANINADGQPEPTTETVEDSGSIASYGRRVILITEDASSNIDTSTEAVDMATAIVSDLANPLSDASVEIPFFHAVELEDLYTFEADRFHVDDDTVWGVVGYRHRLRSDSARTTLTLRGAKASGGVIRWLRKEARVGVAPLQQTIGPEVSGGAGESGPGTVGLAFDLGINRGMTMDRAYEVHAGLPGFAADRSFGSATFVGRFERLVRSQIYADLAGRLPIGELVDVVIFPIDHLGNAGSEIRLSDQVASRLGTHFLEQGQRFAGSFFGSVFAMQGRGSGYPPDGWHMEIGTWVDDVDLDDGAIYSSPQTGLYALTLKNTAISTTLYSDKVPVTHGRRYHWQANIRASSTSYSVVVAAEWLDTADTVVATSYLQNGVLAASGTWTPLRMTASPPSGAVSVRFYVEKAASAFYVSVDKLLWEEYAPTVESEVYRVNVRDDFVGGDDNGRIGDLGWQVGWVGTGDASAITTIGAQRYPAISGAFSWTRAGVVQLTTPSDSGGPMQDMGTLIAIGTGDNPAFYGLPPEGVECRIRLQLSGGDTEVQTWAGLWSSTTLLPDPGLTLDITGVGFAYRVTVAGGNWSGIVRDGTSETTVDLGFAASDGWVELGWRRTASGVQFMVNGEDVGSEVTTNLPDSSDAQTPVIAVLTTNGSAKMLDVDTFLVVGDIQR